MLAFRSVGILYLLSGLWCAIQPELAANFLGFKFSHAAGKAEFFSVYGGLQFGIAVAILGSSIIPAYRLGASFFAFIFSLGFFVFRLLSLALIDQSSALIYMACLEGIIFITLLQIWRQQMFNGLQKLESA